MPNTTTIKPTRPESQIALGCDCIVDSALTCINNSILLLCYISTLEVWVLSSKKKKNHIKQGCYEKRRRIITLPLLRQIRHQCYRLKFSSASEKQNSSQWSDCTRLVHNVASFPAAFCSPSASSWLCASVLAAAVCKFGLPPRAAASCASRSAMRWFSFSSRTFPSWASRSQCSFSCSSRAIFSWLCCTCGRPVGRGEERTVSLWEEGWAEVGRSERAAAFRRGWGS